MFTWIHCWPNSAVICCSKTRGRLECTAFMSSYMWVTVGGSGTVVRVITSNTARQTHTQIASCNLLLSASTTPHLVNIFNSRGEFSDKFHQTSCISILLVARVWNCAYLTALTVDYLRLKKVNFAPQSRQSNYKWRNKLFERIELSLLI